MGVKNPMNTLINLWEGAYLVNIPKDSLGCVKKRREIGGFLNENPHQGDPFQQRRTSSFKRGRDDMVEFDLGSFPVTGGRWFLLDLTLSLSHSI